MGYWTVMAFNISYKKQKSRNKSIKRTFGETIHYTSVLVHLTRPLLPGGAAGFADSVNSSDDSSIFLSLASIALILLSVLKL
jgi:hypothetical protein